MAYSHEHRRQRRYRHSPSSSQSVISSRDDEELEQDIIERYEPKDAFLLNQISFVSSRALEIERKREKSLRRQFEYIVHNVKVCISLSRK